MPITLAESQARQFVEQVHNSVETAPVDSKAIIYNEAMDRFEKELRGKLDNLQIGEKLAITFRIDIIAENGKVRGGSGAQRNMPEYIEWRNAVYRRDKYTCQECGAKGDINAHHIRSWQSCPDLRFDVSNGITLCLECHQKKHPHIGFVNGKKNKSKS